MSKVAVISGAGGALGSVLAERFLRDGYQVHALYHKHVPAKEHPMFKGHAVNLLDEISVNNLCADIFAGGEPVDVLICTAGGFAGGTMENTPGAELQKQYQINFLTAYNLVQPVYMQMKKQGHGKIFLVGSRQGADAAHATKAVAYGLSKTLLFGLAKILNKDSQGKVITTVIVPSTIDTPANRQGMPDADFSKWVAPGSIADVVSFYASDRANDVREPVVKVFGKS